jgi:hypothetical protein
METLERNMAYCKRLGLPFPKAESVRLAVIGGAPSIRDHVEELKNFDGDRWIVAGAFNFCRDNDIKGSFFSVDPQDFIADLCQGAKSAVLASCSARKVFDALKCPVSVFDIGWGDDVNHHGTTASSAPWAGVKAGYKEIHFYGCDSSYAETSHAYEDHPHPLKMIVRCNGKDFVTDPLMLMQAEFMAKVFKLAPHVYINKSRGLLEAMLVDDYDITAGTQALCDLIGWKK